MLNVGQHKPEQRRPEHQAGDQLPHHGRLFEPQHDLAEQPADQHQHHDLRDEQKFGRTFMGFACGPCPLRQARECRQRRKKPQKALPVPGHMSAAPLIPAFSRAATRCGVEKFQHNCNC